MLNTDLGPQLLLGYGVQHPRLWMSGVLLRSGMVVLRHG